MDQSALRQALTGNARSDWRVNCWQRMAGVEPAPRVALFAVPVPLLAQKSRRHYAASERDLCAFRISLTSSARTYPRLPLQIIMMGGYQGIILRNDGGGTPAMHDGQVPESRELNWLVIRAIALEIRASDTKRPVTLNPEVSGHAFQKYSRSAGWLGL